MNFRKKKERSLYEKVNQEIQPDSIGPVLEQEIKEEQYNCVFVGILLGLCIGVLIFLIFSF